MKLVVTNEDPDLDEAASTYAYAQFLKNEEEEEGRAVASKFGDLTEETDELLEQLGEKISDATYHLYSADEIVMVGANTMKNISTRINPDKVIEVIDIEPVEQDEFPNAEITVNKEFSTASAIIAEKFMDGEYEINRESATMLKAAIQKAKEEGEITDREEEILEWLEEQL